MPRPRVRTIRHPPSAVPAVSASAQTSFTHSGTTNDGMEPAATRASVIRPIVFWASFVRGRRRVPRTSPTRRAGSSGSTPRRARRSDRRPIQLPAQPASPPTTGETARTTRTPATPTGRHPRSHPSARRRRHRLRRRPRPAHRPGRARTTTAAPTTRSQVPRHGRKQRGEQDPQDVAVSSDQSADRVGDGGPGQDRPETVKTAAIATAWPAASPAWPPAPPASSTSRGSRW